jgi:ketosteroid isomerase-like protein
MGVSPRGVRRVIVALTLFSVGWLAGQLGPLRLAQANEGAPADSIAARKGVEREWAQVIDEAKRGDWGSMVHRWTPNGVYVHPDYPDLVGYRQLQQLFDKEAGPKLRLVNLTRDVSHFIVDGDLALEGASSVEEWRTLGDTGKSHAPLRYLYVWKRQPDGRWRILYLIETSAPTKNIDSESNGH